MSEIVKELGQRLTPHEMKERAKEAAVRETRVWKDRIVDSPWALGLIGGLVTAGVARYLRTRHIGFDVDRIQDAGGSIKQRAGELGEDLKERAGELSEGLKERAGDLKDRAVELKDKAVELTGKAGEMAHRAVDKIPSGQDMKLATERVGRYVGDEPLIGALAALAAGAVIGLVLPLSNQERQVLDPYRVRAGEKIDQLKEEVKDKVEGLGERLRGAGDELTQKARGEEEVEPLFTSDPMKPTLQ